eukprot:1156532-Pelagomonas_calceolata.AAC.16
MRVWVIIIIIIITSCACGCDQRITGRMWVNTHLAAGCALEAPFNTAAAMIMHHGCACECTCSAAGCVPVAPFILARQGHYWGMCVVPQRQEQAHGSMMRVRVPAQMQLSTGISQMQLTAGIPQMQ